MDRTENCANTTCMTHSSKLTAYNGATPKLIQKTHGEKYMTTIVQHCANTMIHTTKLTAHGGVTPKLTQKTHAKEHMTTSVNNTKNRSAMTTHYDETKHIGAAAEGADEDGCTVDDHHGRGARETASLLVPTEPSTDGTQRGGATNDDEPTGKKHHTVHNPLAPNRRASRARRARLRRPNREVLARLALLPSLMTRTVTVRTAIHRGRARHARGPLGRPLGSRPVTPVGQKRPHGAEERGRATSGVHTENPL